MVRTEAFTIGSVTRYVFRKMALRSNVNVLAAAALAIKLTKGPVFYKSERMGLNSRLFPMYTFRSMVVDADQRVYISQSHSGWIEKIIRLECNKVQVEKRMYCPRNLALSNA
ncbi:MAG: hypothetical protein EOP32_23310 [Rhodococcus sp. (in: high G+C Gram-positive bacteria)]|nr:MAG: hypothetical protein EOP32_23310 [Rhodococcus sp. (in: high G+C Gram-positive bacteria)]